MNILKKISVNFFTEVTFETEFFFTEVTKDAKTLMNAFLMQKPYSIQKNP